VKKRFRKPYRIKKKKSILRNRFFWLTILVSTLAGGIIYFIFFSNFFQIKEIKIVGTKKLSADNIRSLTEENIKRKFLFFDTKSILLVGEGEIILKLSKYFPQIDEIDVKNKYPDILILEIKERESIGCFCQDNSCFLIDRKGIIFEKADDKCFLDLVIASGVLDKRDFGSTAPMNLGEKALEEPLVSSINKIRNVIKESLQININEFNITEVQNRKLAAKTAVGWEIYFNPVGDIDWQLTKLVQVLEKEIPPEKRGNLEYIDLRFGNFAPYKYRD
jgi:hypothetical protein